MIRFQASKLYTLRFVPGRSVPKRKREREGEMVHHTMIESRQFQCFSLLQAKHISSAWMLPSVIIRRPATHSHYCRLVQLRKETYIRIHSGRGASMRSEYQSCNLHHHSSRSNHHLLIHNSGSGARRYRVDSLECNHRWYRGTDPRPGIHRTNLERE